MQTKRITVIQGHPHAGGDHYGHALVRAYVESAQQAGHEVRVIEVAALNFTLLRSQDEWSNEPGPAIRAAQESIGWAQHLVIVYPLWLGAMPAVLKGFFEQTLRPGFAFPKDRAKFPQGLLKPKTARLVVTMGMPAFFFRWYFGAHSVKTLKRNILAFCGIKPTAASLIGSVEGSAKARARWLERLRILGREGR